MPTTAIIRITQFETEEASRLVKELVVSTEGGVGVRELLAGVASSVNQLHLPDVTQPVARTSPAGWSTPTPTEAYWSDSPLYKPSLLYRYRYGHGRDSQELFPQPTLPALPLGALGKRWGNLDDNSGVLIYQRSLPISSSAWIREHQTSGGGYIREDNVSFDISGSVREISGTSAEADLTEYPFLITALPEPNSIKNPIDTDIFIRLSNFTNPLASGTITLYVDGLLKTDLIIEEFFAGLGGFDVTWGNNSLFDYDDQVTVRWEFRDTDSPSNRFEMEYPFYTVSDVAGPRVSNLVPDDLAEEVPIQGTIQFDVEDFENDVDIDSLILFVNNVRIVAGETGTLETVRLNNKKGYTIKYTPIEPWLYGDLIPITIFVRDTSKNSNETFFTYNFTTIESNPPRLINLRPLSCTIAVPVGTHISVDVIDGGHGVDKNSIVFTVEEIERSGQIALIPIVHRDE